MTYTILSAETRDELIEAVTKAISEGYEPLGGVAIDTYSHQGRFVQAMTCTQRECVSGGPSSIEGPYPIPPDAFQPPKRRGRPKKVVESPVEPSEALPQ